VKEKGDAYRRRMRTVQGSNAPSRTKDCEKNQDYCHPGSLANPGSNMIETVNKQCVGPVRTK